MSKRSNLKGKEFSKVANKDKLKGKLEASHSRLNIGYKRLTRKTLRRTSSKAKIIIYKYLPTTTIELPYNLKWNEEDHPLPIAPPSTPRSDEFRFEFRFQRLPNILQDLSTLEIPLVRECGIKRCIEELGLYFGCSEYKFNYLQFWFLDILTDCIWRAQDRYEFPPEQQKIILSWILFTLDIIGDLKHAYTQREFFAIFKESIVAAAEVLEEGSNEILLPLKLIKIRTGHDSDILEESETYDSSSREKTCTIESSATELSACSEESQQRDIMDYESVYEIHLGRDKLQVVLDHEVCQCSDYDEPLSAHKDEVDAYEATEMDWMECEEEEMFEIDDVLDDWDYRDFYKPSSRTPSRFLQSSSEEITEVTETLQKETNISLTDLGSLSKLTFLRLPTATRSSKSNIKVADKLNNYIIFRKISFSTVDDSVVPEELEVIKDPSFSAVKEEVETQEQQIEKIMKGLQKLKLIEQRMRDMSDSNVGLSDWQIDSPTEEIQKEPSVKEDNCIQEQILREQIDAPLNIEELNDMELMNFTMLWAIIDFVYEYFSDSFQYSLIKTAFSVTPNVFTQVINKNYRIPKKISEDLTTKVPDLKEKNKKFYRKADMRKSVVASKKGKEKDVKESKKSKDTGKEKKEKTEKKEKKDKKEKKGSAKDLKKTAQSKEVKLTKEELLHLQKLEQAEALRLKREREKAFMFPLTEAVNDRFFSRKFANWSKFESVASKEKVPEKKKK